MAGSGADAGIFSQADLLGALLPSSSSVKTYNVESLLPVFSLAELRAALTEGERGRATPFDFDKFLASKNGNGRSKKRAPI